MNDLNDRQLATIFAALKMYKRLTQSDRADDDNFIGCLSDADGNLCFDADDAQPLSDDDIESLCEIVTTDIGSD